MQKLGILVITVAVVALLLVQVLKDDQSVQLLSESSMDSWETLSRNRFAYNICSPSCWEGRRQSTEQSKLPLAHTALLQTAVSERVLQDRCQQHPSRQMLLGDEELPGICDKLLLGEPLTADEDEWIDATNQMLALELNISKLLLDTQNCSWVRSQLAESTYVTQKEAEFPIAYAINIDESPHQVFEFLRAIYQPHNIYCFHIDSKASHTVKQVFFNTATCLDNVIVPRKLENVYRGWYTLLDAHRSCLSDLVLAQDIYPWKYVITLCGKELPIRTNAETVALLKPLNGISSVQTVGADGTDDFKFKWKWSLNKMTGWITKRDEPLPPIPYGLKVYKSWAYVALSYQFVKHILCSPVAIALREYMKDVRIPEENFYAMLFMQPGTPGGFRHENEGDVFPVFSCIWMDGDHHGFWNRLLMMLFPKKFCAGTNRHNICVVSARDLFKLPYKPGVTGYKDVDTFLQSNGAIQYYSGRDRGPLFHNKFSLVQDHVAMACMERELARRNRLEYERECATEPMASGS